MRTLPQNPNEHPLNEELRVRQHATDDARRNVMTHADAMAQVQQLIADLQLEDSVVLRRREQRHPAPLSSPSSPVVVDHIPGDLLAPVNHEVLNNDGFERVHRRRSLRTPPLAQPLPPTQRRQTGSGAARSGLAHSQSFAERMNAASFLEDPVAYDARVRAKDVGLREMRAARPREPYGFLEPIDYIIAKSKFQNAALNIELDEMDKVTELANVFTNPAKEIIDGQQLVIKAANMRRVYETLWKRLD